MSNGKPESGYRFGNKAQYRRELWKFADRCFIDIPTRNRKVLILETSEGEEARFLVEQKGYDSRNIHAVNRNPAELAWMTRRLRDDYGITGIHTHAGEAFEILTELIGDLDAVNLDLTAPVSKRLKEQLESIKVHDRLFLSITVLRGREQNLRGREPVSDEELMEHEWIKDWLRGPTAKRLHDEWSNCGPPSGMRGHDFFRLMVMYYPFILQESEGLPSVGQRWSFYRSTAGTQTMLWFARFFMDTCVGLKGRSLKLILDLQESIDPVGVRKFRQDFQALDQWELLPGRNVSA